MQYPLNPDKNLSYIEKWQQDPFFAPDTVVLGIDIGVEGIGIAVRKGAELLYCKSLIMELPQAAALKERRQFRASRHARKNRHTRMYRLSKLFEKHGLPWVSNEIMSKSDPFVLRYRAINGKLASKEALSICIRSVVAHRGYDFFAMVEQGETDDAGEFPWGESDRLSDAQAWIKGNYIDKEQAKYLKDLAEVLTYNKKELDEQQINEFRDLIDARVKAFELENIEAHLKNYVKNNINNRKARNANFPRSHVKEHLTKILERHREFIENYDDFVKILFLPCDTKEHKNKAIFHFNRKTPHEAYLLYEKKVKSCPWCTELGLSPEKCGKQNDQEIILWNLLDFVSVRTFEFSFKENKKTIVKRGKLPEAMVCALIDGVRKGGLKWNEIKKMAEEKGSKFAPGEWNKSQLEQLKDICSPPAFRKNKRANISTKAAKALFEMFTENEQTFAPDAVEALKKGWDLYKKRQQIQSEGVSYPQVRTLLGTLVQKGKKKNQFATTGFLQRLFEKELCDKLGGKTVPDYCVIECIKNPARSSERKKEIEEEQKKNRARTEKLLKDFGKDPDKETITNSDRLRSTLFSQQGGTKDKPAVCPFTGQELGNDPFAPNLELAHIFPDSRGGVYMRDNLVLTTREVNAAMGNRTPYEAAQENLPGWLSWEEMKRVISVFHWGKTKCEIFAFIPNENGGSAFPDFNNMTYTAQLARELRNMVARWMGISGDAERLRKHIGNPHGVYTAAARKRLTDTAKDRETHTHHRVDAFVLSCLPPMGLNYVQDGGVFLTEKTTNEDGKVFRQLTYCLPKDTNFLPKLSDLEKENDEPPVIKLRSNSKYKSLGLSTYWSYSYGKPCLQRCPFTMDAISKARKKLEKKYKNGLTDSRTVMICLKIMGISDTPKGKRSLLPSEEDIQTWIYSQTPATKNDSTLGQKTAQAKTFRLNSSSGKSQKGTPVKHFVKIDANGGLDNSPLKWSGIISKNGKFDQLRSLDSANDRLEIWLGWNPKKKQWEYQKRIIPTRAALLGIKRMGIPWRGRNNAPEYLIQLLNAKKAKDLKTLVCGALFPYSKKVATFRKGDVFFREFFYDEDIQGKKIEKSIKTWGAISGIESDSKGGIVLTPLTTKIKTKRKGRVLKDIQVITSLKCLPDATEQALRMNLAKPE